MCLHVLQSMDIPNQHTDIRLYRVLRKESTYRTVNKNSANAHISDLFEVFDPLPS